MAPRHPRTYSRGRTLLGAAGCLFALGVGGRALADAPVPAPAADPCKVQPSRPEDAAQQVFDRISLAWRSRLPGPAGERALVRKVSALVGEHTDFMVFATRAFGRAWGELDAARRDAWRRSLEGVIEHRYLDKVGSPVGARLEIRGVEPGCPEANLDLRILHRDSRKSRDFSVEMRWDGSAWRVVDAVVDEASLLDIYRTRFGRAYRDGGLEAVHAQLVQLARRFGAPEPFVPEPVIPEAMIQEAPKATP